MFFYFLSFAEALVEARFEGRECSVYKDRGETFQSNDTVTLRNCNDSLTFQPNDSLTLQTNVFLTFQFNDSITFQSNDSITFQSNYSITLQSNDSFTLQSNDSLTVISVQWFFHISVQWFSHILVQWFSHISVQSHCFWDRLLMYVFFHYCLFVFLRWIKARRGTRNFSSSRWFQDR